MGRSCKEEMAGAEMSDTVSRREAIRTAAIAAPFWAVTRRWFDGPPEKPEPEPVTYGENAKPVQGPLPCTVVVMQQRSTSFVEIRDVNGVQRVTLMRGDTATVTVHPVQYPEQSRYGVMIDNGGVLP